MSNADYILGATRALMYSAQMARRRALALRASRFLAISPDAALALYRTSDDCETLRARIVESLHTP